MGVGDVPPQASRICRPVASQLDLLDHHERSRVLLLARIDRHDEVGHAVLLLLVECEARHALALREHPSDVVVTEELLRAVLEGAHVSLLERPATQGP